MDVLPGNSPTRTPEGGMGYVDAYGNALRQPEEKATSRAPRLRNGAYGGKPEKKNTSETRPRDEGTPLWRYK